MREKICRKYIIYNEFDDHLIFEGNYMNRKGKEYDEDKLILEGEYLNGKRNGNGKLYDDSKLIFDGVLKNELKNGKCLEYYNDDKIRAEGEFLNDNYLDIKEYDKDGNIISKMKNGKGIFN